MEIKSCMTFLRESNLQFYYWFKSNTLAQKQIKRVVDFYVELRAYHKLTG